VPPPLPPSSRRRSVLDAAHPRAASMTARSTSYPAASAARRASRARR
jgi:hypothetical protein